jgi:hypothetical protein
MLQGELLLPNRRKDFLTRVAGASAGASVAKTAALGAGRHHLGNAASAADAAAIVHEAVEGGVTVFDNSLHHVVR